MNNITKDFKSVQALKDVTFEFNQGEVTGLIGFNGSGKTTTFNILVDFINTTSGDVLINGKKRDQEFFKSVGYVSASDSTKNMFRAISELKYYGMISGLSNSESLIRISELAEVMDFTPYLKKQISSLSKGNQQKVKLMAALMNPNIQYLLLDEPFDGLDPLMVNKLKKYILNEYPEASIIITSHRMDIVNELCTKYYILKEGDIVATSEDDQLKEKVTVNVNVETKLHDIKKLDFVIDVERNGDNVGIVISSINDFKSLSKELLGYEGYVWHSLSVKSAVEAFWEGYGNDD